MTDENFHEDFDTDEYIKRVEAETKALFKEHEQRQKEADERAEVRKAEVAKENDAARKIVPYEDALAAAKMKHVRMPNEGSEDYSDLPESIHVPGPKRAVSSDLAPPEQYTQPELFEPVAPPELPDYPDSASEPELAR
jgi:hypothetical protein